MGAPMKPLTKKAEGRAYARLERLGETLTFIRHWYSPAEQARAADLIVQLEGERAYLRGLLDA